VVADSYIERIPVRNLWLLMLYASDLFRTRGIGTVGLEDSPDELPDLVAEILAFAVERRQRRQLSRGFAAREAVLNRVRGRIDALKTERHQLLARGLVACRFDELMIDTPRNRFVRAALESICRIVSRQDVAHRCRTLVVCIVHSKVVRTDLGSGGQGSSLLSLPDREAIWVRRLFERAVGGFYEAVLSPAGWQVRCGGALGWKIDHKTPGIDEILPTMRTDVVLDHAASARRIVIDTKFTSIVTAGWRRDETLRSGYIYQIYAYLRSQVGRGDSLADSASGVLLHPSVGPEVDQTAVIQGHSVRFATVDLTASASTIARVCYAYVTQCYSET